ncbi:hypothetical protein LX16_3909 [Stackebrandtia albiflava]|uniref:Immunity protein Imm1 n=1 Tax=Stackebrandtia albiflava TaxID=406432 RepID=A0A562UY04_9ACTN|nr:hypothetical protein [Stackebrandtia albiflava]TWJ10492.1 hypothetical protein LX16_3909 [Stackebrandtia albiflava]
MEPWTADGEPVTAEDVGALLRGRMARGRYETRLTHPDGRSLTYVTNGERAMVMLLRGPGDAGGHATSPGAVGHGDGFRLENGQDDEYPDADTVPLPEAFRIVAHLLATAAPPADAAWRDDR